MNKKILVSLHVPIGSYSTGLEKERLMQHLNDVILPIFQAYGLHPSLVEKEDGQLELDFNQKQKEKK